MWLPFALFAAVVLAALIVDAWLPRRHPEWAHRLAWRRRRDLERERELDPSLLAEVLPETGGGYRSRPAIDATRLPWPPWWTTKSKHPRLLRGGHSVMVWPLPFTFPPQGDEHRQSRLVSFVAVDRELVGSRVHLRVRETPSSLMFTAPPLLALLAWAGGWLGSSVAIMFCVTALLGERRLRRTRDSEVRMALDEIEKILVPAAGPAD